MSNSANTLHQQACLWIAKLNGEPSSHELAQFRAWMAQSPAHKAEMRRLAQLWQDLNVLTELAVTEETPATASRTFFTALLTTIKRQLIPWKLPLFASAAAITLAVFIVPLLTGDHSTYSTGIGEQQRITLSDGSSVLLNTNSQLTVDYTSEARNITLTKGQAHFDVMPDKLKPFNVYAGQGIVRAVGTAFSVYLKPEQLEVTVTEGTIELSAIEPSAIEPSADKTPPREPSANQQLTASGQPTATVATNIATNIPTMPTIKPLARVTAGQNVTLNHASRTIEAIETVDAPAIVQKLAWHQGLIRFSGDPLQEVVAEVSRYSGLSIVITDPEIRDMRIGGFFKVGETEKMLQALETSFGLQVTRLDNNVVQIAAAKNKH